MVYQLTKLFREFAESEKSGGYLLMFCALVAIIAANSTIGSQYLDFWRLQLPGGSLEFWINDGLMAIFFLLIGLEIERELYVGELSDRRNALLPVGAAIGGMVVPAAVYLFFNTEAISQRGFGIPMATDIAFALGVLSLAGNKIPNALKVFLTALAIIDDLGAILVIAIFYTQDFSWLWMGVSAGIFALMIALNRFRVNAIALYLILGAALWYTLHATGIHATIAGVITAFTIPFGKGGDNSPSARLQHALHKPVAFMIMPLFALANAGLVLEHGWTNALTSTIGLGIILGLVVGKPLGIGMGVWLALRLGAIIPSELNRKALVGGSMLAGIGFTMSIFITLLAFETSAEIEVAKTAILFASLLAGLTGYLILAFHRQSNKSS
ncbi:MAG: Na+/H+ antiporter NhaA [Saprospiraceae bacterium]|nr:Na+/H+ antiporter NhaA [Saprospiraceae bacterium]